MMLTMLSSMPKGSPIRHSEEGPGGADRRCSPVSLANKPQQLSEASQPHIQLATTACTFSETGHFCKVSYVKTMCTIPSSPQMLQKILLQIPNLF